jgi:hypothetical protein
MGSEGPGGSQPIINEWVGAWVVPGPGEGGLSCPWARVWITYTFAIEKKAQRKREMFNLKYNIKSYFLIIPNFP